MTGTSDRPQLAASLVTGQLTQGQTEAAVLELAQVLDVLYDGDGQGARALLHPHSTRGTRLSDTRVADHVTIGTDRDRGASGDLETHGALDLVTELLDKVLVPPAHLIQLTPEAVHVLLGLVTTSSIAVCGHIKV